MARPISPNFDNRRRKIIDCAAMLFATEGYHKASINAVARTCDISKSLIYHYFSSKDDLLFHCMIDHVEELDMVAERCTSEHTDPGDCLNAIIRNFMRIYMRSRYQQILLLNALDGLGPDQRKAIRLIEDRLLHRFGDLAEALSPVDLQDHKARSAVAMLLMGMMNWTHTWYNVDGPVSREQLTALVQQMVRASLASLTEDTFARAPKPTEEATP